MQIVVWCCLERSMPSAAVILWHPPHPEGAGMQLIDNQFFNYFDKGGIGICYFHSHF